ncbi:MAG: response regulator receiver protein [Dehalococcoidales bacterium]|nr:response regulator receiver protein [Dehalococcoidales bacterium]
MTTQKKRILLVDDDSDFVEATKMLLETRYNVSVAYEGNEGIRKAKEEKPDLIILDVIMPKKDGFAVCEELKGDPNLRKIPIMLLTSFAVRMAETTTSVAQAMITEAEDYMDKPVSPAQLFQRVEKVLKR